jgi:transcriptional regulator with XRE-family HTH domain
MTFGDRLKGLRLEMGITQKALSKVINISDRVIGYYESNDRFPKDERILCTLADYFGVSLDYLVGRTNIKSPASEYISEPKVFYNLDIDGLPEEALKKVQDYIDLLKLKYQSKK